MLVHEILAGISSQQEVDFAIERYYLEGQISNEEKQLLADQLQLIFSNSQVQDWFNTKWEVKTETAIIIKDKHPKRPDRVLFRDKDAIIIDFKTGIEKAVDQKQILSYRDTLKEMGFLNIEAYLLYIGINKVVKVA